MRLNFPLFYTWDLICPDIFFCFQQKFTDNKVLYTNFLCTPAPRCPLSTQAILWHWQSWPLWVSCLSLVFSLGPQPHTKILRMQNPGQIGVRHPMTEPPSKVDIKVGSSDSSASSNHPGRRAPFCAGAVQSFQHWCHWNHLIGRYWWTLPVQLYNNRGGESGSLFEHCRNNDFVEFKHWNQLVQSFF